MNKTEKLGKESIGKLMLSLSVPAITGQIVNMLYNIVDRIYIGHIPEIGGTALAGVGLTLPVIIIISAFSSLIGMGGAPHAAIRLGENKKDQAESILGNCFSLLLLISVILTAFFLHFGEKLLWLFGASEKTINYGLDYLNIYVIGTVFVQLTLGLNPFITTQGYAKTGMLTVIIGAVTNSILDPIFIFVFNMGVKGAAVATVISQGVSAIWVITFLSRNKPVLKLRKKFMRLKGSVIAPVLLLGVSPFIMSSTEGLLLIAFNSSLQKYGGDIAVGAMTILSSLMQLLMLPLRGLTQGAQPIISYNYGAKNNDRVKKAFKVLLLSSIGYALLFWTVLMSFPRLFVSIFNNEDMELINYTVWALRIYFSASFVLSVQNSCQQTFVAVGQAKISVFLALLRKIILLIPLIYILPAFFENKIFAVFLAEPVSDTIAATVTATIFAYRFKKILKENKVQTQKIS